MQFTGDGYLAAFEDPNLALQAAIKVQSRLKTEPISAEKDGTVHRCIVRIGLHQSEQHLTPNNSGGYDDAYSQIAYAHRVMEPGCDEQILVSQTLWKAAGGRHQRAL